MSTYLPGVEADLKPGTYASLIEAAKREGREYSKIWDLFAFAQDTMHHLSHLTQGIMRQPASISEGLQAGELVIVTGAGKLVAGQAVEARTATLPAEQR